MTKTTPINLTYRISLDDYLAMNKHANKGNRGLWARRLLIWGAALGNIAFSLYLVNEDLKYAGGVQWISLLNAALGLFLIVLIVAIGPRVYSRHYRTSGLDEHDVHLTAHERGLETEMNDLSSQMGWKRMVKIERTQKQFFFWISKLQAVIVPFGAFENEEQREQLWQLAQQGVEPNTDDGEDNTSPTTKELQALQEQIKNAE